MNGTFSAPHTSSRPKIHRLPNLPPPAPSRRILINYPLLLSCLAALGLLVMAQLHKRSSSDPADSISNASDILPPVSDAQASVPSFDQPGQTMRFQDKDEVIIGRLARIPAQNEQITEIKPISEVDKDAGRELLSIISKY